MLKKTIVLVLTILMIISCTACGNNTPEETIETEPVAPKVFENQSSVLDYITIGDNVYMLNAELPNKLTQNGFAAGTNDTATALSLGYPKGDAKYLYYKCDEQAANCVYCCVVEDTLMMTISYRVVDPTKLGVSNALYSTANSKTYYADYLHSARTIDEVLSYMGEPTEAEMNDSNFITSLLYEHKNDEGKVDNKIEIEFVGENVYKINITKKLKAAQP